MYKESITDPSAFWSAIASEFYWKKEWDPANIVQGNFDTTKGPISTSFFSVAQTNIAWNCLDAQISKGRGDTAAFVWEGNGLDENKTMSYSEVCSEVNKLANWLRNIGVKKGDRVIIYMPMIPEGIISMLACARIGAIHSVVFGGFAANELAVRIDDAKPKAILAASCGLEPNRIVEYKPLIDQAIELASHKPTTVVVFQRAECKAELVDGRDHDWNVFQENAEKAPCVPVKGSHPAYILYTSGTTGAPKGVVRPTAGHLVALNWTMKNFYNVDPGEVFWAASDIGWIVGHSYICYAPLIHGNTTLVFEGKPVGTPDAGTFWRVISEHKVSNFFTAPTAFRAIKRMDPKGELKKKYDLSNLRALFLAGERADPDTVNWAENLLQIPIIDHWWQTETGYVIAGNPLGIEKLPIKVGSPTVPMPGFDIKVLDRSGSELPAGQLGSIAIKLPLPPGTLPTLWNAQDRFESSYLNSFPGYYETGDAGIIDDDGYIYIMARTDDVINVAGHRLSTGAIEEVLANHPDVAECAVIGVSDNLKGQLPVGFLCLTAGVDRDHMIIETECVEMVRKQIGPVAAFKNALVVDRLPKTRSGKILRGTMVKIANNEEFKLPATIDDPVILQEIEDALIKIGYAK